MVKDISWIIFGCLILALGLWGCDDDGKNDPLFKGCRLPDSFPEFEECPTEAFMRGRVCTELGIEIEDFDPAEVRLRVRNVRTDCEFPDCFTMDCAFTEQDASTDEIIVIHNGVFSDVENFPGPGLVSVEGEDPVEYSFFIFQP